MRKFCQKIAEKISKMDFWLKYFLVLFGVISALAIWSNVSNKVEIDYSLPHELLVFEAETMDGFSSYNNSTPFWGLNAFSQRYFEIGECNQYLLDLDIDRVEAAMMGYNGFLYDQSAVGDAPITKLNVACLQVLELDIDCASEHALEHFFTEDTDKIDWSKRVTPLEVNRECRKNSLVSDWKLVKIDL